MSGPDAAASAVDVAVDNDVLWKAACYGLAPIFWAQLDDGPTVGVLGAAPFVLADLVARSSRVRDRDAARRALEEFFARATPLEPSDEQMSVAAELEQLAQRAGLELDIGESQLAAIVATRDNALLDTGDKRAVRAFAGLVGLSDTCARLCGRVRCLEQLLLRVVGDGTNAFDAIASAVCAEADVDKTASICFGCYSKGGAQPDAVRAALQSYLDALRTEAPDVLAD